MEIREGNVSNAIKILEKVWLETNSPESQATLG